MFLSKYLLMWKFEKRPLLDLHSVPHIDPEFQNYCCCHHILHRRTIGTYLGFFRNKIWERCQGIFQSLFSASKYLKIQEKKLAKKSYEKKNWKFFHLRFAKFNEFSSFIQPCSNKLRTSLNKFKK